MRNKDKTLILFMILLVCFINILQANKINNLENQIAQQEQTIVKLQENVIGLSDIVTELNIKVK